MNREILFRGKRVDNGEWVYGGFVGSKYICTYLGKIPDILCNPIRFFPIGTLTLCEVIPETVGQFTGLTDKNGTKIFEGDILTNNSQDDIIAEFYKGCFINSNTYIILHTEIKDPISRQISFEITGNIHDNPTT